MCEDRPFVNAILCVVIVRLPGILKNQVLKEKKQRSVGPLRAAEPGGFKGCQAPNGGEALHSAVLYD